MTTLFNWSSSSTISSRSLNFSSLTSHSWSYRNSSSYVKLWITNFVSSTSTFTSRLRSNYLSRLRSLALRSHLRHSVQLAVCSFINNCEIEFHSIWRLRNVLLKTYREQVELIEIEAHCRRELVYVYNDNRRSHQRDCIQRARSSWYVENDRFELFLQYVDISRHCYKRLWIDLQDFDLRTLRYQRQFVRH